MLHVWIHTRPFFFFSFLSLRSHTRPRCDTQRLWRHLYVKDKRTSTFNSAQFSTWSFNFSDIRGQSIQPREYEEDNENSEPTYGTLNLLSLGFSLFRNLDPRVWNSIFTVGLRYGYMFQTLHYDYTKSEPMGYFPDRVLRWSSLPSVKFVKQNCQPQ